MTALKPDRTLTTASIPPTSASPGKMGDGRAIIAAMSREATDRHWQNPASGARGLVDIVNRTKQEDRNCLAFKATRESFDGISLYRGLACENPAGTLRLHELVMQ